MSFLHTPTLNIHWESHKESENLYFIYIYIYILYVLPSFGSAYFGTKTSLVKALTLTHG